MLPKPKRRLTARARRIVAITAGVAMAVSAVAVPNFTANAAETPTWLESAGYGNLPAVPEAAKQFSAEVLPGRIQAVREVNPALALRRFGVHPH